MDIFDLMIDWFASPSYLSPWEAALPPCPSLQMMAPICHLTVPTASTAPYTWLAFSRARRQGHTLLVGPTACGKTLIGSTTLRQPQQLQAWTFMDIALSRNSSARFVQSVFEHSLQRKKNASLGAPVGSLALAFIDDVSFPAADRAEAKAPLELLRQVVDSSGGIYDLASRQFRYVHETALLAASCSPVVERSLNSWLPSRFRRHFHVMAMPAPSRQTLSDIFGEMLTQFFGIRDSSGMHIFSQDMMQISRTVGLATIELLFLCASRFKAVPSTFFYSFGLRDALRVAQGIGMAQSAATSVSTTKDVAKLWAHECFRVFGDRLTSEASQGHLSGFVEALLQAHFKTSWRPSQEAGPLRYGDFLRKGLETRVYEHLPDEQKLGKVLYDYLAEYNASQMTGGTPPLRLVLFQHAVDHMCRIIRVCRYPRGHMLLIGGSGTGRRSLCMFAAFIAEVRRYAIEATAGKLAFEEFRAALKGIMRSCGIKGRSSMVFLLGDDFPEDSLFEDVNTLLNIGMIHNVWNIQESQSIQKELLLATQQALSLESAHAGGLLSQPPPGAEAGEAGQQQAQQPQGQHVAGAGGVKDPDAAWRFFLRRVRDSLHVMLCMSPVGGRLRSLCQLFPAMLSCCSVNCLPAWPEAALQAVAAVHLEDLLPYVRSNGVSGASLAAATVRARDAALAAAEECVTRESRAVHVTPRSLLDHCGLARALASRKGKYLERALQQVDAGLGKLRESYEMARELKQTLVNMQTEITLKDDKLGQLAVKIGRDQQNADEIRITVDRETEVVEQLEWKLQELSIEAKAELDAVMPDLKAAIKAVEKLDKKDIQDIRSFASPPPLVATVMEAVCLLLGHKTDWTTAKNVLSDLNFLRRLKEFERDSIQDRTATKLKQYVKREDFDPQQVSQHCAGARALCMWCRALSVYNDASKEVEPKRNRIKELSEELSLARKTMLGRQTELEEVASKLSALEDLRTSTRQELQQLQADRDRVGHQLECAQELMSAFKNEETRWAEQAARHTEDMTSLAGDVLVAAACVAYFGAFGEARRASLVSAWLDLYGEIGVQSAASSPNANEERWALQRVMVQPTVVLEWRQQGLPDDKVLIDSAIVALNSLWWPFCLDPQGQARRWLQNHLKEQGLQTFGASSYGLQQAMEDCLLEGKPLLVTGCGDELPALLTPVLGLRAASDWKRPVHLGHREVKPREGFALYLASDVSTPKLSPRVFAAVSVVNFSMSFEGLAERLLGEVLLLERPGLEADREELVKRVATDECEVAVLTDRVLGLLSHSDGNILDQPELISTLTSSVEKIVDVSSHMQAQQESMEVLARQRSIYQALAQRGAVLYFAAGSLSGLCETYSCSLSCITRILAQVVLDMQMRESVLREQALSAFESGFEEEAQKPLTEYVEGLVEYATSEMLTRLLLGFREEHRLVIALHACIDIGCLAGTISQAQRQVFLAGAEAVSDADAQFWTRTPDALCFPPTVWRATQALSTLVPETFEDLPEHIENHLDMWRAAFSIHDHTLAEAMGEEQGDIASPYAAESLSNLLGAESGAAAKRGLAAEPLHEHSREDESATQASSSFGASEDSCKDEPTDQEKSLCNALPTPWCEPQRLESFDQLLVIRATRPQLLMRCVREYVRQQLPKLELSQDQGSLMAEVVRTSSCRVPLLVLVTSGSDPRAELSRIAIERMGNDRRLVPVTTVRNQVDHALRMVEQAREHGHWVLMQHCQLEPGVFVELERFTKQTLDDPNAHVHEDFRLFIACYPKHAIPAALALQCDKVAIQQPPRGIRAKLRQACGWDWESYFDSSEKQIKLGVGLALFHAVVCSRGSCGSPGFTMVYDFTNSDQQAILRAAKALSLAEPSLEEAGSQKRLQDALMYLVSDVHHGGSILDSFDRRCLQAAFSHFVCDAVPSHSLKRKLNAEMAKPGASVASVLEAFCGHLRPDGDLELMGLHAQTGAALRQREMEHFFVMLRTAAQQRNSEDAAAEDWLRHATTSVMVDLQTETGSLRGASRPPGAAAGECLNLVEYLAVIQERVAEIWGILRPGLPKYMPHHLRPESARSEMPHHLRPESARSERPSFMGSRPPSARVAGGMRPQSPTESAKSEGVPRRWSGGGAERPPSAGRPPSGGRVPTGSRLSTGVSEGVWGSQASPMLLAVPEAGSSERLATPTVSPLATPRNSRPTSARNQSRLPSTDSPKKTRLGTGQRSREPPPAEESPGSHCPLRCFLMREWAHMERLQSAVQASLIAAEAVLGGSEQPSPELDALLLALAEGRVPRQWSGLAYPSCRPLMAWIRDLAERVEFFQKLLPGALESEELPPLPSWYWMSGFFSPRGFLTSTLQRFARAEGKALDRLTFKHVVESHTMQPSQVRAATLPVDGSVLAFGMYMEGCRWDVHNHQIEDCRPGQVFCAMPGIRFLPVLRGSAGDPACYCPLKAAAAAAGEESKPPSAGRGDSRTPSLSGRDSVSSPAPPSPTSADEGLGGTQTSTLTRNLSPELANVMDNPADGEDAVARRLSAPPASPRLSASSAELRPASGAARGSTGSAAPRPSILGGMVSRPSDGGVGIISKRSSIVAGGARGQAAESVRARIERMRAAAKKQALAVPDLAVSTATKRYDCPLYRTCARVGAAVGPASRSLADRGVGQDGVVCTVVLPTAACPDQWVLRGLALLCEPPQE
eukprot:TRINITY_DN45140_c0_g3_i1.p1 TRINITY_DN45140_c0_g3~~TRINITY_DN45140_c0_g3_i1.p1  ORF type:complete len:3041 (-),score=707.73 TRINITY_DN45140_c0_g3_i1:180-8204(-)